MPGLQKQIFTKSPDQDKAQVSDVWQAENKPALENIYCGMIDMQKTNTEPVDLMIYGVSHKIVCSICGYTITRTKHPAGHNVLICGCLEPMKEDTGILPKFWNIEKTFLE